MKRKEQFVAKTFAGLETILKEELETLGAENCQLSKRAVTFEGDFDLLYKTNYYSRYALRILWQVHQFDFRDNKQFYENIYKYPAENVLDEKGKLAISVTMHNTIFQTPLFAAQLAKDAICDRFRERTDTRPSVDKEHPDVQFHLHLNENMATLFLDASGDSLHKRGYRVSIHPAQINEVLAAGIIKLSGWQHDCDFIDPMCGSGTILIEAAMQALNIPAGFYRKYFGFYTWKNFDRRLWNKIKAEADIHDDVPVDFYGYDISPRFIGMAQANVRAARLADFIHLQSRSMFEVSVKNTPSCILFNPPYGKRLDMEDISDFYKNIGNALKQHFAGCKAFIISSNMEGIKNIGLHPSRKYPLFNGPLECKFLRYDLYAGTKKNTAVLGLDEKNVKKKNK